MKKVCDKPVHCQKISYFQGACENHWSDFPYLPKMTQYYHIQSFLERCHLLHFISFFLPTYTQHRAIPKPFVEISISYGEKFYSFSHFLFSNEAVFVFLIDDSRFLYSFRCSVPWRGASILNTNFNFINKENHHTFRPLAGILYPNWKGVWDWTTRQTVSVPYRGVYILNYPRRDVL